MNKSTTAIEGTNLSFYTTNDDNGWGFVITPVPLNIKNSDNGFLNKEDAEKEAITRGKEIHKLLH